jgi:hypothetical protein
MDEWISEARHLLQWLSFGYQVTHGVRPSIPEGAINAQRIPRTSETGHEGTATCERYLRDVRKSQGDRL